MNNVCLIGRVTKDVQERRTQNGTPVVSFTLAVDRRKKEDGADFIPCIAWDKAAETIARYVHKGDLFAVTGYIQTRSYEKDGRRNYATEVVTTGFKFLQKQYGFEVLDSELPIVIFKDDMPIACGRLDITMLMDGETGIADIKTVSALNKEKIAYQLNLYRIGLMQSYGVDAKFLKIIHLRDGIRKVIDSPVNEGMTWELIEKFLEEKR